jgi:hypothetical protein
MRFATRSPLVSFAATFVTFVAAASALYACSTGNGDVDIDDVNAPGREAGTTTGTDSSTSKTDSSTTTGDSAAPFDPSKVCAQELAYFNVCKKSPTDINCTAAGYEAWCKINQDATDSEQRVRAKAACLDVSHCDKASLADCIYKSYNTQKLSANQQKLLTDYCATCEPGVASCAQKYVYSETKGPDSVDDVYIAVWELSDALVTQADQKCTGPAVADAGSDAGTCARRFAVCAGNLYVDALPACPK